MRLMTAMPLLAPLVLCGCGSVQGGPPARDTTGAEPLKPVVNPGNAQFYGADGAFNPVKAKEAYYAMMEAFGYPLPPVLKTDQFWVSDFLDRNYEKVGMAGIFWINEKGNYEAGGLPEKGIKSFGYLGHEIYLLPGQMIPEHRHIAGPEGYAAKMEAWHIRHGSVEFFGEYKGTEGEVAIADMPEAQRPVGFGQPWFKSKFGVARKAGQIYRLTKPESWHFQRAGANGAIVTEYATYHNHVAFSKPGMEFKNSGPK